MPREMTISTLKSWTYDGLDGYHEKARMNAPHKLGRGWHGCSLGAAVLLSGFLLAPGAQASTSLFNDTGTICTVNAPCWQPGWFGVLVGNGQTLNTSADTAGVDINGAVGVGTGGKLTDSTGATQTWTGPIDFADAIATGAGDPACPAGKTCKVNTGTNISKVSLSGGITNGSDTTGVFYTEAGVTSALNEVMSISSYWNS